MVLTAAKGAIDADLRACDAEACACLLGWTVVTNARWDVVVANSLGTSVANEGECGPAVAACDAAEDCAVGEFCQKPDGQCGGEGECAPAPFICAGIFAPVCGCDGQEYDNACAANSLGTSVANEGECP